MPELIQQKPERSLADTSVSGQRYERETDQGTMKDLRSIGTPFSSFRYGS